ncbi:Ca-activated chloride channel family protein [Gracilibacillus ureilyticus]|uniref:Ca-activated chloride channel family protein n=1 Tax=Gracilibacillus ureilyticus TaxID=531814 RepID=A0A1H9VI69_9BACI|nr:VWA domain-containing protein [Gracilibacillus ureilyticus]SES21405.1 Ca-activated chloride channel family protein [Gracilibacillus ureilyticus]
MKLTILSLLLSFSIFVLVACEDGDKNMESNHNATNENMSEENDETNDLKESNKNANQSEPTLLETAPELPTNIQEIADYPVGPLAGNGRITGEAPLMPVHEMADYVMEQLPALSEEASEEELDQWFKAYRSLFAEDYPDPNQLITEIQVDQSNLPQIGDKQISFKDHFNVLVILDVSKSMVNEINGEPMIDIAKGSIEDFIGQLPEGANVGLRVYGHDGENTTEMRALSCQASELVYPLQPLDQSAFGDVLDSFHPAGWTPIALSLEQAKQDFEDYPSETNNNLVYVVSDGAETCDGDPVEIAKELVDSNIEPIINVIGFNVDGEGEQELQALAEAGEGVYTAVGDEEELNRVFEEAEELLLQWKEWKSSAEIGATWDKRDFTTAANVLKRDWEKYVNDETSVMRDVLFELQAEEYLGGNFHYLLDMRGNLWHEFTDYSDDIESYLVEKIENNYDEAIDDINDQYNDNVEN